MVSWVTMDCHLILGSSQNVPEILGYFFYESK